MRRVCAWCNVDLGLSQDAHPQEVITHGLCDACAYHLIAQMGMPLQEYLDGLGAPVLVVNAEGIVETANTQARALLEKGLPEIEGYRGGDVFECTYARLPGGCGKTIHCTGCAIRRTVTHTYDTTQSHARVLAYLNMEDGGDVRRIPFLISTQKVQGVVLLRIDEIGAGAACESGSGQ